MSTYTWGFLINPFLSATEDSYRLAVKMCNDYFAALQADSANPQIAPLIPIFEPLNDALAKSFSNWEAQGGEQLGDTLQVKLVLKNVSGTKAKAWDNTVQTVYADTTPDYKKLFPHHRIPYQRGTQTEVTAALAALSTNLSGILALSTVKTDVDAVIAQLADALNTQKTAIKLTGDMSILVEAARVAACVQIFADYGNLLNQNAANPLSIGHYFPIKYIRTSDQIFYTHMMKPVTIYTMAKHGFLSTDRLKATTNTPASVQFFNAFKKDAPNTGTGVMVPGNSTVIFTADKLGDIVNNHFLIAANLDQNLKADFDLEFL